MTSQTLALRKRAYMAPPKLKEARPKQNSPADGAGIEKPTDEFSAARKKPERGIRWAQLGLQFGLAMNSLAGNASQAHASEVILDQTIQSHQASAIDLALDTETEVSLQESIANFQAEEFTTEDAQASLRAFAEEGGLHHRRTLRKDQTLTPEAAARRLRNGHTVHVELLDGSVQAISNLQELQALDTFNGAGIKPIAAPEVVRALRGLELGIDSDDGLIRNEFGVTDEEPFTAYQAYRVLSEGTQDSTGARIKGALIGGAIIGAGIGLAAFGGGAVIPGLATAVSAATPMMIGAAGAAVGAGMLAGGYLANRSHQMENPSELEVRFGLDDGLKVKTLEHAVDAYQWLQDRAANPFTEQHQTTAINHFDDSVGFFDTDGSRLSRTEVRERLAAGEAVNVPSSIAGHSDTISNLRELQQLDTVRGSGVNMVVPPEVAASLRELESGSGVADGLYRRGNFDAEGRLSAFEAVDALFKERQSINVILKGKQYDTQSLRNVQELNALMGDGVNTILPEHQFEALTRFGNSDLFVGEQTVAGSRNRTSTETVRLDAYEALHAIRTGQNVKVNSRERFATVRSLQDLHELKSLEFDRRNSIIGDRDFDLLNHWDNTGSYSVDNDGQADYAYEALQALQSGNEFGIVHRGRTATVGGVDDMVELATFETPEAGFEHSVADLDRDLLLHWERSGTIKVDGDHDEFAYEGLQALQAGRSFEIQSQGRFAPVGSQRDMAELSAFETPDAGFAHTIPADQFARLKHFEGLHGNGTTRVGDRQGRGYEGYRALRTGRNFDVQAGGVWNTVTSPQSLHDLDALLGRGVNDILPQDQYDLLKHLGDGQSSEGLRRDGTTLNSYSALQLFRDGEGVSYDFNGGDFGNRLHINTPNLESLERTREIRDNQKEYDRYAYSAEDLRDKMQRQVDGLPEAAENNLEYGQSELRDARSDLSRAESDLSDAERDLDRAKDYKRDAEADLDDAEDYLRWARGLDTHIDEDVEYCNDAGDCWWETESVYNHERDREIRSAQSDVSTAEGHIRRARSDISQAESDIRSAESDITSARRAISRAQGLISDAEAVLRGISGYEDLIGRLAESNLNETVNAANEKLSWMESRTHESSLQGNIDRQQRLLQNQSERPSRPNGWVAPAREDLAQF